MSSQIKYTKIDNDGFQQKMRLRNLWYNLYKHVNVKEIQTKDNLFYNRFSMLHLHGTHENNIINLDLLNKFMYIKAISFLKIHIDENDVCKIENFFKNKLTYKKLNEISLIDVKFNNKDIENYIINYIISNINYNLIISKSNTSIDNSIHIDINSMLIDPFIILKNILLLYENNNISQMKKNKFINSNNKFTFNLFNFIYYSKKYINDILLLSEKTKNKRILYFDLLLKDIINGEVKKIIDESFTDIVNKYNTYISFLNNCLLLNFNINEYDNILIKQIINDYKETNEENNNLLNDSITDIIKSYTNVHIHLFIYIEDNSICIYL